MKLHHLLFSMLCFSGYVFSAASQYPCGNALYYGRSLAGDDEFLLCHSQSNTLSILYGPIKEYTPEIDIQINEKNIRANTDTGRCKVSLPLPPHQLILVASPDLISDKDTLTIYHQDKKVKMVTLDKTTRINFLRELDVVKDFCEKN